MTDYSWFSNKSTQVKVLKLIKSNLDERPTSEIATRLLLDYTKKLI